MADDKNVAAGKRFSRDMRRIREDCDVSVDEIHNDTRIARTLIQSFEEGGLYEHPTFNRVYLRSFVRAYAESIEISPDAALTGLDAALDGTYDNDLAVQYLDADPASHTPEESSEAEASDADGTEDDEERPDRSSESRPAPAGGPDGRGGIVGPPREMTSGSDTSDPPSEEISSDPDQGDGQDSSAVSPSATPESEEAEPVANDSAFRGVDESDEEEPTTDDQEEESPFDSASERDDRSGDAPSWLEGDSDEAEDAEEAQSERPTQRERPTAGGGSTGDRVAPAGGSGSSGIVGEPTELGSGGSAKGAKTVEESQPGGDEGRPPRGRTNGSSWFGFDQREVVLASVGILVIVLVLVGLGFAFLSTGKETSRAENTASANTASADTMASPVETPDTTEHASAPERPPANLTLGETIHLTVLATGKVEEIRIQRDDDLRRPYWIEEGEAEVYPFQERITLENELADVRVFVEQYPYSLSSRQPGSRVVITREDVEAFADTLRGTPTSLSVAPDTIPKGEPDTTE